MFDQPGAAISQCNALVCLIVVASEVFEKFAAHGKSFSKLFFLRMEVERERCQTGDGNCPFEFIV